MFRIAGRVFISLFVLSALFSTPIFAQSTGAISGLVSDPSGSAVPNVPIKLTNEQTGTTLTVSSDSAGLYTLPFIQPGDYALTADATGFKRFEQNAINVATAAKLTIDVHLEIGSTSGSVTVNGNGIEVNTSDGAVSTVVDQQFVANIPLNGRSVQDLIDLTPGVTTTSPQSTQYFADTGDFSVNGQRTESNYYIVDGVSANFSSGIGAGWAIGDASVGAVTALGTSQSLFSLDDLQEFRVLSSSYSAEYGHLAGGQFIFTTRSGTNDFHGSLYDYLRNNAFDANNWFNDYVGLGKPPERQNDFDGTLGGPVRIPRLYNGKDKTFFFFSYEGLRLQQPQAASIEWVPDLNLRANSVAAIKPILNAEPLPNQGVEGMIACGGTTFSNTTPYPCPSGSPTGTLVPSGLAEFAEPYSLPANVDAYSGRVDHNFSSKMSAFFRFEYTPSVSHMRENGLSTYVHDNIDTTTYTFGLTNQLSSNIINSFRLGFGRMHSSEYGIIDSFGGATPIDLASAVGIGASPDPEPDFYPLITGVGGEPFFLPDHNAESTQWNLVDTVSVTKGHHQLNFGFDYRRVISPFLDEVPSVVGTFSNAWQIENNLAGSFGATNYFEATPVFNEYSLFAQDEWRVAPRLSLSMGLRWELDPPPTFVNGPTAAVLTGSLSSPSSLGIAPAGTPLWQTPFLNFAPRLGVAYQVRTQPGWETVLRSGGGVFFDNDNSIAGATEDAFPFYGHYACPSITCGYPVNPAVLAQAVAPTTAPYTSTTFLDTPTHLQLPYTLQWNLSVQQSLGKQQSLTVSYIGASGRRLPDVQEYSVSSLNPNFGAVWTAPAGIHSNYNALETVFQRTLSHGLQALVSYTWSHSLDNLSGAADPNPLYPVYGSSDFDLRHNFTTGVSWDLPSANYDPITKAALSHWGLDVHFVARSGFPVQPQGSTITDPTTGLQYTSGISLNTSVPLYLSGAACTAYYVANGNPNKGKPCPGGRAINPAAFSATGTLLNTAPRNIARGFGENQINTAIRREFPIRETLKLQFRTEMFNILNHPNFGSINRTIGNATFGQATATLNNSLTSSLSSLYQQGGPRSMQFALKLIF